MFYSNFHAVSRRYAVSFGNLYAIALGTYSKQKTRVLLPAKQHTVVQRGTNADLTIGFGRTGHPRLERIKGDPADSPYDFFLVSSESGPLCFGNGEILVRKKDADQVSVMCMGFSKREDSSVWSAALLRISGNAWIRVIPSGKTNGLDDELYLFQNRRFTIIPEAMLARYADANTLPFTYDGLTFKADEWLSIELLNHPNDGDQ